ncbi:MAG: hypothetical protein WKH97_20795 [Casimicrobiaceae bacterium]
MNTLFAAAGRATANVIDGAINVTQDAYDGTAQAAVSFAAGWKTQRRRNALQRRGVAIIRLKPIRA